MTWHLKDRLLEQKLIEFSSNFLEQLQEAVAIKDISEDCLYVQFCREREDDELDYNELYFWMDELEEVCEYNPNDWNEYPMVIPQTQRFMRLEVINSDYGGENTYIYKAQFKNGLWIYGDYIVKIKDGDRVRFRPWED